MEVLESKTTIAISEVTKAKLMIYGKMGDTQEDAVLRLIEAQKLQRKFIDEQGLAIKFESWLAKQK